MDILIQVERQMQIIDIDDKYIDKGKWKDRCRYKDGQVQMDGWMDTYIHAQIE